MPRKLRKPWLESFLELKETLSAPPQFKYWAGISAIASSLKKNVWIKREYKIYPNQFVVLVGPPGIGKGLSIDACVDLVREAGTANYIPDRITAEKMLQKLETGFTRMVAAPSPTPGMSANIVSIGDKSCTIVSGELQIFLTASEWMIPLLCEIWNKGTFSYETKNKGSISATDLCVSLIGGCVPEYIKDVARDSTAFITSGFSSRCIFVFANSRVQSDAWPEEAPTVGQLQADVVEDLKYISNLKGEFKLTDDAMLVWKNYHRKISQASEFDSDIVYNFKSREISHVLKLAMVLSISEGDSLRIDQKHLLNAISLIDTVRNQLDIAFRSVGESPLAAALDRIQRFVELRGAVTINEIHKANMRHVTFEDLNRILISLEHAGYIRQYATRIKGKVMILSTNKRRPGSNGKI